MLPYHSNLRVQQELQIEMVSKARKWTLTSVGKAYAPHERHGDF